MAGRAAVVLTGASRGLGLAIAQILLRDFNANVIALQRTTSPELRELASSHSDSLLVSECDIADEGAVKKAIAAGLDTFKHIDGVILNAGVLPLGRVASEEVTMAEWKSSFDVNFFSLVTLIRATLPELRKSAHGGRIVFMSSGAAVGKNVGWAPYNAAKAAMNSLCRTLAAEEPDITCVALRPGMVDTNMQAILRESAGVQKPEEYQKFVDAYGSGTLVKPEDAGYVAAGLALKAPKSLSGQFVPWNGEECKDLRRP